MNPSLKREKNVLNISFIGSIIFLLAEIIVAIVTGSNAIFMDCVFDIADLIMIGPFILLVPLLYKPETEKRPYGFSQVESLFILIKSGLLIGVTLFLVYESIETILTGGNQVDASKIAIFELSVSFTCVLMYILLSNLSKKIDSPSIKAELYIWKLDALSTLGVGITFILKLIFDQTSLSFIGPYVDPVIAIVLAMFLLKEPIGLFIESINNLILFAPDNKTTEDIKSIVEEELKEHDCYVNFLDIIKTGRKIWIEIYFVVDKDLISIEKLKKMNKELLKALKEKYDNIYVELIPDIEKARKEILKEMKTHRRPDKINYLGKKTNKRLAKKATKKLD